MKLSSKISKALLSAFGWKIQGQIPTTPKGIFVVVPHTHWQDIPLGFLVRSAIELKVHFVAKKSLFTGIKGRLFYYLGGYPVDRSKNQGFVDAVAQIFEHKSHFFLAIAPEGTRKKVTKFKTGFYYIAQKANIPMYLTKFDFQNKIVHFSEPRWATPQAEDTIHQIEDYFRGVQGKIPSQSFY